MADLTGAAKSLNFITDNFDNEDDLVKKDKAVERAKILGLNQQDLIKYRNASQTPEDPNSIKTRNYVFSKVANSLPSEKKRGVLWNERLVIKNLIDENPSLQKKYLDEKGYETRIVGDRVEMRRPDEPMFKVVDPEGLDWSDLALEAGDVSFDLLKGLAEVYGLAAKGIGTVLGPSTLGASIAAGFGSAAGVSGATELARQETGRLIGVRPKTDLGLVAQEAAIGGTTGALLPAAAGALKNAASNSKIAVAAKLGLRKGSDKLEKGLETLGGKITEGMKFANENVRELEDAIVRHTSNWFPTTRAIKEQYRVNAGALSSSLMELLEKGSQKITGGNLKDIEKGIDTIGSAADQKAKQILNFLGGGKNIPVGKLEPVVGTEIRKDLVGQIGADLEKANKLYDKVESSLLPKLLIPEKKAIYDKIESFRPTEIGYEAFNTWLDQMKQNVDNIKSFTGMKEFGTRLLDEIEQGNKSVRSAGKAIRSKVIESKSDTFRKEIDLELARVAKSNDPTGNIYADALKRTQNELAEADRLTRKVNQNITAIIKRPNVESSRAFTSKEKLDMLANTKPEDIFSKIASSDDIEKAQWLVKNYPQQYTKMVEQKIGNIWLEVAKDKANKDPNTRKVILNELEKMTPSEKLALLGENAQKTILDLNDIVVSAANSQKMGKFINDLSKKISIDEEFTKNVTNRLNSLSNKDKLAIFGVDSQNKLNALIDVGNVKQVLVNPSKTALSWDILNPSLWGANAKEIAGEYKRIRDYKKFVLKPEQVGKTRNKVADTLNKPKTFGKIEAARSALTTPKSGEQE
jgi:hypothetical protein